MRVAVLGAGAFGTALAVTLARNGLAVTLWARDAGAAEELQRSRCNARRLPGVDLPDTVRVTHDMSDIDRSEAILLTVPMQELAAFLVRHGPDLAGRTLVGCAKGLDLATFRGSSAVIAQSCPASAVAILTGPSFAQDIARGLPTALTLACEGGETGARLQTLLSTPMLRLYRTTDVIGAELGGALKNVIAIGTGVVIGAGLGDSARASLLTRGFAEMNRLALALGARAETLAGLSGLGDLVLTCTSTQSRNFRFGVALGQSRDFDASVTVEGAATARAAEALANRLGIELPVTAMISALVDGRISVSEAAAQLMSRPLRQE